MAGISNKLFSYRSYTPIPFIILLVIFAKPTITSLVVGFIIAFFGEFLRLWGVSWAGSETRTTGGVGGSFLIISGPFAYIRNPLYIGNILLYVGIGLMSWALFPYLQVAALIFFTFQYHFIVLEEEGYLIDEFSDYSEYCKQVPRFYPRLTPYKNSLVQQPPFSLKAGLRSEQRSLQAFLGVTLIIVIIWIVQYS